MTPYAPPPPPLLLAETPAVLGPPMLPKPPFMPGLPRPESGFDDDGMGIRSPAGCEAARIFGNEP